MSPSQGNVKLATLQKSLIKIVAGNLNIFIEVQKEKFEIQTIAQMVADITVNQYHSKYSNNKYLKDYVKSNSNQSFLGQGKSWKTRESRRKN